MAMILLVLQEFSSILVSFENTAYRRSSAMVGRVVLKKMDLIMGKSRDSGRPGDF
jgi:hypothetical protein